MPSPALNLAALRRPEKAKNHKVMANPKGAPSGARPDSAKNVLKSQPILGAKLVEKCPKFGTFSNPQNPKSACEQNFSGTPDFGDFDERKPEIAQNGEKHHFLPFAYTYLFWLLPKGPNFGLFSLSIVCSCQIDCVYTPFKLDLNVTKTSKTSKNTLCVHRFFREVHETSLLWNVIIVNYYN